MTATPIYRLLRRSGNTGFTLIELLVALMLFSLLSMALLGSIRLATSAWRRVLANADQEDHILHAQTLLRRLVENAYPLYLTEDPANEHVDFRGTKDSLALLTTTPMALRTGGRSRVTVSVDRREGRADLVLASNLELLLADKQAARTAKVLLNNVDVVTFSYFGKARFDKHPGWHDHWTQEIQLPRLVRIRVNFLGRDRQNWPDLVIAPRINADVGCVYDRLTKQCRGR